MSSSTELFLKAAADAVREMRSLCQPDTARGGAPGPQVWTSHNQETVPYLCRSWREVRSGTELFQNFRIVTTPVHVPQCF